MRELGVVGLRANQLHPPPLSLSPRPPSRTPCIRSPVLRLCTLPCCSTRGCPTNCRGPAASHCPTTRRAAARRGGVTLSRVHVQQPRHPQLLRDVREQAAMRRVWGGAHPPPSLSLSLPLHDRSPCGNPCPWSPALPVPCCAAPFPSRVCFVFPGPCVCSGWGIVAPLFALPLPLPPPPSPAPSLNHANQLERMKKVFQKPLSLVLLVPVL